MARRVLLIVLGILLLVIGALIADRRRCTDGILRVEEHLEFGRAAGVDADPSPGFTRWLDSGRIRRADRLWQRPVAYHGHADRRRASPFPGHRPSGAVDRYLSGVSYDAATNVTVTPFHLTLVRHGGTATPPPPESQSFWVAKASGNNPALTWTVTSGSYRVVIMNTNAAAPVAFAGGLDLTIPHSFAIGIGLLIGGIVLILIGIVLIVLGARSRPPPQSRPVPGPAAGA